VKVVRELQIVEVLRVESNPGTIESLTLSSGFLFSESGEFRVVESDILVEASSSD
jgi:hypothetical protein